MMKYFLKGAAVTVVVMIVLIIINMICNMNGHELDSVSTGTVASVSAMLIYGGMTKKEKNKDDQEWKIADTDKTHRHRADEFVSDHSLSAYCVTGDIDRK